MLLWFCAVIDPRGHQNVIRTSVKYSTLLWLPLFCSYHILISSVLDNKAGTMQHDGNLFISKLGNIMCACSFNYNEMKVIH